MAKQFRKINAMCEPFLYLFYAVTTSAEGTGCKHLAVLCVHERLLPGLIIRNIFRTVRLKDAESVTFQ